MTLDLQTIEALAPDQASLKAASKLIKPGKWPLRCRDPQSALIWGECQGSGANPYRCMADTLDHGYKCTCPSRKFPCKHVLALLWMFSESADDFTDDNVPEWVTDWVGRRRKPGSGKPAAADNAPQAEAKNLSLARAGETDKKLDPKSEARRKAAAEMRAAETKQSVAAGLDELDQWVADQLRVGLHKFLNETTDRCRRIAARLVDAKATALASRLDDLPARLFALPAAERPDAAISELGQLVLLAQAWRASSELPDVAQNVTAPPTREDVLSNPDALRVSGRWEVLAERISTGRDNLIAQSTWLLNLDAGAQIFALLLDFFPAGTGRRGGSFASGDQFDGELIFYPSKRPLRALIAKRDPIPMEDRRTWSTESATLSGSKPLASVAETLNIVPWTQRIPLLVGKGRFLAEGSNIWWCPGEGTALDDALPVMPPVSPVAMGMDLDAATAIWNGQRLELLAGYSSTWGRIAFDG